MLITLEPKTITNAELRLLLSSEYLAFDQSEIIYRFELINNNKILLTNTIELENVIQEIKPYSPKLAKALSSINTYPDFAHPMDFVVLFKARLEALGFLQDKLLDSPSYQCFQRAMLFLDEFQELAFIKNQISFNDAMLILNDLAMNSVFQLQQPRTNINILGILEASGATFENIWVCNLTDKSLPNQTNFSAFIPIELQKNLSMPHTSLVRELDFARKQLLRFQNCANNVVFSFASFIDDIPMIICPLIKHLPLYETNICITSPENVALVEYIENYLVPVIQTETINGGTSLLANQAKCPFKAFASHRLHASEQLMSDNQNAIIRGQIMHKIMELIWRELKTQDNLLNIEHHHLQNLIADKIQETLKQFKLTDSQHLEDISNIVEVDRLKRLVNIALDFEKKRPKFQISAIEEKFNITLAEINFKIRVDRIDNIEQGKKLIIDYKSSLPISLPWFEDRPDEPQLLLYALLDDEIKAIAYAQLTSAKLITKGISFDDIKINGVKYDLKCGDWQSLKQKWASQLTNLAFEFKSGLADPNPSKEYVCTQCSFQNLCRKSIL
jgi:ATP-dependent helicase/nuclease subunit B